MRYSQALAKYLSEEGRRLANLRWVADRRARVDNPPEVDADTLRSRALYDRKGKLLVSGVAIYHSTSRSDQFDVFVDGKSVITGGPRVVAEWLKQISAE